MRGWEGGIAGREDKVRKLFTFHLNFFTITSHCHTETLKHTETLFKLGYGNILPTGQWYAPSAVINAAFSMPYLVLYCTILHYVPPYFNILQYLDWFDLKK